MHNLTPIDYLEIKMNKKKIKNNETNNIRLKT